MTYVPVSLISWDWVSDIRGIVVGAIGGGISGIWLSRWWDRFVRRRELDTRMSAVEHGIENVRTSLAGQIEALDARLDGQLTAINTTIDSFKEVAEAHQKNAEDRHDFLVETVKDQASRLLESSATRDKALVNALAQLQKEVREHFTGCKEGIIGPMQKDIEELKAKVA